MNRPLMLIVLDGLGLREETEGNAVRLAETPVLDELFRENPWSRVRAVGEAVGLPEGQIGNSEVGHMNMGAGRTVYQPLTRIHKAIEDGSFYRNEVLRGCVEETRSAGATLHLIGLLSDGGVHSHLRHLFALLELAGRMDQADVAVHAQLDGRDVPPRSAKPYLRRLQEEFESTGVGRLATMGGRYYGMDRDERWDRTEKAYRAMVEGTADVHESDPIEALERAYGERDEGDEFVTPTVFTDEAGDPRARIQPGDGVIFFNFRPDRARQLTRALTDPDFDAFETSFTVDNFACMARYDEDYDLPVAFPPLELKNVLSEYLSDRGLRQYHLAETEKYAHVTFFFNGGREDPFPGEERTLIPSPRVSTYDRVPAMSAPKITETLLERLRTHGDDFVVVNFANPDMVGHTGDLNAAIRALEVVDRCLGSILEELRERDGEALITADHGNVETMVDPRTGDPHTAHTTNDCPLIYVGPRSLTLADGSLPDIAPTLLDLLDLPVPEEMTGKSLIGKNSGEGGVR